jgi:ATP-dependent DNA helicase RecG
VIREALVNALMHRDYRIQSPTLLIRYSNRLEIRNAGYSLKADTELGEMGSRLRNPILAGVLYDLGFAETKGTGIATMRRLLLDAGLTAPILLSDRQANHFTATYFLHQLLTPDQLIWLQQFQNLELDDNEAKALVLVKEMGAIDNAALRAVTGLETLAASALLRRLGKQLGLLEKGGSGSTTYYKPSEHLYATFNPRSSREEFSSNESDLPLNGEEFSSNESDLPLNGEEFSSNESDLPSEIAEAISHLGKKARKAKLWPLVLQLCTWRPCTADELAHYLQRSSSIFKVNHLKPMREAGLIAYLYPEVINHPQQAYQITPLGEAWLQQH